MNLRARWLRLMSEFSLTENIDTYASLQNAYAEPHRHYHNISHLLAVLNQLDAASHLADRPHEVELALWFHDAIYKPFSSSNEADSAKWAYAFLNENKVNDSIRANVTRLILATSHNGDADSGDEKLIVDIDLTVLGQSSDTYKSYCDGVRKEYRQVPSFIYRWKRKALLRDFISKESIYHFALFRKSLEGQARCNLQQEIQSLQMIVL